MAMKARVQSSGRSGRDVVVCERASKRYGDRVLLDNANFIVTRGERVGIVGPNGAGKTTLIEMILGEESPDAGYIRRGHGVTVAYHKQEVDDFDPDLSVLENFYDLSGMMIGEVRQHLAKFLFTGEDVFKPVSALSGGERSKLAMALMVLSPANLLILDEPTNHLDVYSCEALTEALNRYDGTLLVVSHDRALLDAATNKTLAFEGTGKLTLFDGPYHKYRDAREAAKPSVPAARPHPPTPSPNIGRGGVAATNGLSATGGASVPANAHALSKERQRAAKRVATLEAEVEKLETRLAEIEAALSSPSSADEAVTLSHEYARLKEEIAARMGEWEAATLEAEAIGAA
jgi:ATP-binding cassette subfamily F protein 3